MNRRILAVAAAALVAVTLAGCTTDPLAEQYADGSGQGYISGDGAYTEIPVDARGAVIEYAAVV